MSAHDDGDRVDGGEHRLSRAAIRDYADQFPDVEPTAIAGRLVLDLDEGELRRFAVLYVTDVIERERRATALAAELRAQREAEDAERRRLAAERAEREAADREAWRVRYQEDQRRERERARELQRTRPARKAAAAAAAAEAEARLLAVFAELRDNPDTLVMLSEWDRPRFREWMGDGFAAWYESRTRETPYGRAGVRELFEPFVEDSYDDTIGYLLARTYRELWDYGETKARAARLELTRELLGTEFALGDGARTTWGAATREQHEHRAAQLTKGAASTLETAVRHRVAARMLAESGATSLDLLADLDAAA